MMCTLAKYAHTPALQGLSGYVMMAPFLKISDHLKPPTPVLLIAKALAVAFPKCLSIFSTPFALCCKRVDSPSQRTRIPNNHADGIHITLVACAAVASCWLLRSL